MAGAMRPMLMEASSRLHPVKAAGEWLSTRFKRVTGRAWLFIAAGFSLVLLMFASYHGGLIEMPATASSPPPPPPPPYPPIAAEGQMIDWVPPDMDALIHGVTASEGLAKQPNYQLIPFPYSPMTLTPEEEEERRNQHHPWLGAVICSPWDVKRRMLIRWTWMKLYKSVPMDQRFVVSNPGPQWTQVLMQENATYGDMIVLDHLPADDFTANTIKTIEFYRWLVDKSPRKYQFVSKMDTDLWVNARGMWDRWILPRLDVNPTTGIMTANVNHTIIGQFYYDDHHKSAFPHGAIYTATWDLVELIPTLQDEFHVIAGEDLAMTWLLMKGKQKVTLAILNEEEKFEYDHTDTRPGEVTAWARNTTDPTSQWHALYGQNVLAVHQLKSDEDWLKIAKCFDENGVLPPPTEPQQPLPEGDDKHYPRAWHWAIPDRWFEKDTDGRWLVNGVWKLEPGIGRDLKRET